MNLNYLHYKKVIKKARYMYEKIKEKSFFSFELFFFVKILKVSTLN